MATDPVEVLRAHAEGWLEASQDPKVDPATRAQYRRMAREFAVWARQESERQGE